MDRDIFNLADQINIGEARKQISFIYKQARENSKPTKCALCGKTTTSFCNSHSVPRFMLESISDSGMVLTSNALVGLDLMDEKEGLNKAGTFITFAMSAMVNGFIIMKTLTYCFKLQMIEFLQK